MSDHSKRNPFDFDDIPRSQEQSSRIAQNVISKVKRQQSQADLLDFGFVKIWTIVIEFMSALFVHIQKESMKGTESPAKGVNHESR